MKGSVLLAIASAILVTLLAVPANAQATRTWVSGVGDDANPCSRTAPCKTFAGTISKTAAGGEINCLDPGGFGGLTITKSITVKCDGVTGGVLVSGTNGIVVSGSAGVVFLSGLDFEGTGTGLNGVSVVSASTVYILNCIIRDFGQNGVSVNSSVAARVIIKDSLIANNGTAGSSPLTGGVNVQSSGVTNGVSIFNTVIDGNKNFAAQASGTGATVGLVGVDLTGSPTGLNLVNGGVGVLIGPSNVVTGAINGTPLTSAFK